MYYFIYLFWLLLLLLITYQCSAIISLWSLHQWCSDIFDVLYIPKSCFFPNQQRQMGFSGRFSLRQTAHIMQFSGQICVDGEGFKDLFLSIFSWDSSTQNALKVARLKQWVLRGPVVEPQGSVTHPCKCSIIDTQRHMRDHLTFLKLAELW